MRQYTAKFYDLNHRKISTFLIFVALLLYLSDRSYLISAPKRTLGLVIYNSATKLESGIILPGKLTFHELVEEPVIEEPVPEIVEIPPLSLVIETSDIKTLYDENKAKNDDVIGYLYLPNSKINYPILYKDTMNDFYLTHDIDKKKSSYGAIYLEDQCLGKFENISLIHGHSMKDKSMFGQLLYFKEQGWADQHRLFYIFDGITTRVYQVFACVVVNANTEQVPLGFASQEDKIEYFDSVMERSMVTGEIVDMSDIIILNTCSYEANNMRALVYASRISPEYENGIVLVK